MSDPSKASMVRRVSGMTFSSYVHTQGIQNPSERRTLFTLPWRGGVCETSSVARCGPGWGDLLCQAKESSPHPDFLRCARQSTLRVQMQVKRVCRAYVSP